MHSLRAGVTITPSAVPWLWVFLGSFPCSALWGARGASSPLSSVDVCLRPGINAEAPVKLCYHCRTELAMLEVSGSWLFHVAMNILWERKYLVSDSFYSAATHRLVTFQKSPKSNCCLSVSPSFTETRRCPALLRCAHALVVNGSIDKIRGVQFPG